MEKRYKIAGSIMEIAWSEEKDLWAKLEQNYEPFRLQEFDNSHTPTIKLELKNGLAEISDKWPMVYQDIPVEPDMPKLFVYRDLRDNLHFKIIQPQDDHERIVLKLTPDYKYATAYIEEKGLTPRPWQAVAALTASIQLAYYLSSHKEGILFSHASSLLKDGKAYLFLGKSGTGKSTHSRMWKKAFQDAVLLNDDHPIIKIDGEGNVLAYGSPWSGKTPCYKNLSTPIGGIVRILRGDNNSIRRLSLVEAYASVLPSMFSAPFVKELTNLRHRWLEKVVATVPCYELHCLPDVDAAHVCSIGMKN